MLREENSWNRQGFDAEATRGPDGAINVKNALETIRNKS